MLLIQLILHLPVLGFSSVFRWLCANVGTAVSLPHWGKALTVQRLKLSFWSLLTRETFSVQTADSGKHWMSSLASTWINVFKHFLKCSVFPSKNDKDVEHNTVNLSDCRTNISLLLENIINVVIQWLSTENMYFMHLFYRIYVFAL